MTTVKKMKYVKCVLDKYFMPSLYITDQNLLLLCYGQFLNSNANIQVYQTMPAGIGEHSDVTEAVIEELNKMSAAYDRIEMIEKYFEGK